jgi:SAM-dependent methyltransferase
MYFWLKKLVILMFEINFDPNLFKKIFPAAANLDVNIMRKIFLEKYVDSGIASSTGSFREYFVSDIQSSAEVHEKTILEIGPFDNPLLSGNGVRYFDVMDRNGLNARAKKEGRQFNRTPVIDFVHPEGDLREITEKFDICFSSHCIEHQVDLIKHLDSVFDLLNPGGKYCLIIPDKRFCFDYFFDESKLEELIGAHWRQSSFHMYEHILEHECLLTHNDSLAHWLNHHGAVGNIGKKFKALSRRRSDFTLEYKDVHAWRFTPESFLNLMRDLVELDLLKFSKCQVDVTPFPRQEFTAILFKD